MHSSWTSREGGPWGFSHILFRGYLGLSENLGGPLFLPFFRVLLHFYVTIFRTLPPPPSLVFFPFISQHRIDCQKYPFSTKLLFETSSTFEQAYSRCIDSTRCINLGRALCNDEKNDNCMLVTHEKITYVAGSGNIGKK